MARPAISDVAVSILGIINFSANLVRVTEPQGKGETFKMICPTCTDPTKPTQKYLCPTCSGQFSSGELDKAREVGKTLHRVSQEDVASVRTTSLPEKEIKLVPYKASEVLTRTFADGVAYRLDVAKFRDVGAMAVDLVAATPELVYVGQMNAGRGTEKLFQLTTWNGALVLQEIARPDEVIEFEAPQVAYDTRLLEPAKAWAAMQVAEFSAEDFASRRKARLAELDATVTGDAPVAPAAPAKPASGTDDLLAMLQAQIDANKGIAS
jgi:non-homologous end joining protein Ku